MGTVFHLLRGQPYEAIAQPGFLSAGYEAAPAEFSLLLKFLPFPYRSVPFSYDPFLSVPFCARQLSLEDTENFPSYATHEKVPRKSEQVPTLCNRFIGPGPDTGRPGARVEPPFFKRGRAPGRARHTR